MGFDTREEMMCFEEQVARANMSGLYAAGKLRWAFWNPMREDRDGDYGTWMAAFLDLKRAYGESLRLSCHSVANLPIWHSLSLQTI